MKTLRVTLSLLLSAMMASAAEFVFQFVGQQEAAPVNQFWLHLEDHYNTLGELRSTRADIRNTGELFGTTVYVSGQVPNMKAGETWQIETGGHGLESVSYSGPAQGLPADMPPEIQQAINPQASFIPVDGQGIAPGYMFSFFHDGTSHSIIDYFNTGQIKFGLQTTGEFTYIAAAGVVPVPERINVFLLTAAAFAFIGFAERRTRRSS